MKNFYLNACLFPFNHQRSVPFQSIQCRRNQSQHWSLKIQQATIPIKLVSWFYNSSFSIRVRFNIIKQLDPNPFIQSILGINKRHSRINYPRNNNTWFILPDIHWNNLFRLINLVTLNLKLKKLFDACWKWIQTQILFINVFKNKNIWRKHRIKMNYFRNFVLQVVYLHLFRYSYFNFTVIPIDLLHSKWNIRVV